jgi:hypothetical protein
VAKKNPNQNKGISVLVKKNPDVRVPLPCIRLERLLLKLLQKAGVRSTQYIYTIQGNGKAEPSKEKSVEIKTLPETTLAFRVTVMLWDGEFFTGILRAPVKCANDGLQTELNRAALEINTIGWSEPMPEKEATPAKATKATPTGNQAIQRNIEGLLKEMTIEANGLERDILRLVQKRTDMLRAMNTLEAELETLRSLQKQ